MEKIVVVGTGDLYYRFLAPSLKYMQDKGEIKVLATVDIKVKPLLEKYFLQVPHIIRKENEPLSSLLTSFKKENPIIFLGHANNFHLRDAINLLEGGFRVILEKPYALNKEELIKLKSLLKRYPSELVLADYYLTRKAIPLVTLLGATKENSFYHTQEEVFVSQDLRKTELDFHGQLKELIGEPISIESSILEGNADSGRLESRGIHLYDIKAGGGMIQDLGLHAIAPLFLLKSYLGNIDKSFRKGNVRIAQSNEYLNSTLKNFNILEKDIAETYAEIYFNTSKKIPIKIIVGKYVADRNDQKKIVIFGKKGRLVMDLLNNTLIFYKNGDEKKLMSLVNAKHLRYYPVITSALFKLNKNSPFKFNLNEVLFDSQEFILHVLEKSRRKNAIKVYSIGEDYTKIFGETKEVSLGRIGKLNQKEFASFFKDYSRYLFALLTSIDTKDLNKIMNVILEARRNNNTIFFVGNGGSAATASHFSQDLAEVGRKLNCKVFNSLSLTDNVAGITAAANDHGYDKIFSFQMQGIFRKGDVLVAISASGNSPNVLEAAKFAKERGGVVVGLVGFDGGKLATMSDYVLHVRTQKGEYGPVEDVHMIFDHVLTSYLYCKLKEELDGNEK